MIVKIKYKMKLITRTHTIVHLSTVFDWVFVQSLQFDSSNDKRTENRHTENKQTDRRTENRQTENKQTDIQKTNRQMNKQTDR